MITLLIVDDQYTILHNLANQVDWKQEGVERVLTAQNAMEARLAFRTAGDDGIQVMLCDIEMPVENGITLCHWVRSQNYDTKITFLTCHSEFEYAKEAISLNVQDYLIQPAPIAEIRNVVRKMVDACNLEKNQKAMLSMADNLRKKRNMLLAASLQNYLRNGATPVALESVGGLSIQDQQGYLLLVHNVCWREKQEGWTGPLLLTALSSFLTDIFGDYNLSNICGQMDEETFCALLYLTGEDVLKEDLTSPLHYLCNVYEMYMPCDVACCVTKKLPMMQMRKAWAELIKQKERNVARHKGLLSGENSNAGELPIPEDHWRELLNTHACEDFQREITQWLQRAAQGDLTQNRLVAVYQSFVRILYGANEGDDRMNSLFAIPEFAEVFSQGMRSVEHMKKLVCFVSKVEEKRLKEKMEGEDVVQTLMDYINTHLTEPISRDDLASLVHLNPDYVAKIFRKRVGMSPKSYIIQQKMLMARELLRTTNLPVSHVAVHLGYTNFSHFSAAYKKQFGISPQNEEKD